MTHPEISHVLTRPNMSHVLTRPKDESRDDSAEVWVTLRQEMITNKVSGPVYKEEDFPRLRVRLRDFYFPTERFSTPHHLSRDIWGGAPRVRCLDFLGRHLVAPDNLTHPPKPINLVFLLCRHTGRAQLHYFL